LSLLDNHGYLLLFFSINSKEEELKMIGIYL
jgi:hypothetical protein